MSDGLARAQERTKLDEAWGSGRRVHLTVPEDLGLLGETAASAEARGGRGERWDRDPRSL